MRFLYCAVLGILLCLFSCKSSKDISSMILKSHQQGSIDSVIVSDYLDWNQDKHEGVGLQKYVKTQYNKQGNTTQIEEVCRTESDSFVLLKKTNFKYDKKNRLVEKEIINFDITGYIKNTLSEKRIKRKKNVGTWTVDYGVEVRTFDNDTETIRFLPDSESVDTGLTYCKKIFYGWTNVK